MSGGGAEREGVTESEAGSRLWAVSTEPDAGLELTDREIMTWAEVRRLTDRATQAPPLLFLFKECLFLCYLFLRERECVWTGKEQRERESQNLKQAPGSEPSAQSRTRGSNSRTVRSWPEPKSDAQLTEPPRRPKTIWFYITRTAHISLHKDSTFLHLFFKFMYLFWENEGERESQAGSTLSVQSLTGSDSRTVRSWPELKSDA